MRWFVPGFLVLTAAFFSCGASRPEAKTLLEQYERYERDAKALEPESVAGDILRSSEEARDQAKALLRKDEKKAYLLLVTALADARVALALAQADRASSQAEACRQALEQARRGWEDSMHRLIEMEQVARRAAPEFSHDVPAADELRPPDFPSSTLETPAPPLSDASELSSLWQVWADSARAHTIPIADLEERFTLELSSDDKDEKPLYQAGRTLQELEARIRRELSLSFCAAAAPAQSQLAESRAAAQDGILELERGLKEGLLGELEKERAESSDRMKQLWGTLQQLQGQEIVTSRTEHGVIIHLPEVDFDPKKSTISRRAELDLVRIATILNQYPELSFAVEGHAAAPAGPGRKADPSKLRAQAVFDFLVTQGVAARRMTIQGYAAAEPDSSGPPPPAEESTPGVDLIFNYEP